MHQKYTRQAKDSIQCIKSVQERVMKAKVSKLDIPSDDSDQFIVQLVFCQLSRSLLAGLKCWNTN